MLRGMRKASSNWLGKTIMAVVMGVLIISFGIWGIADIFRGFGQSTLAKVGHIEISLNQFRQLYTDRLQQISRQFGRPLTTEQARAFGLDRSWPRAAENADRSAEPLPERAALDRIRQTRRGAGRHHRSALAGDAGGLFRRSQDPVPRARISQTILCADHARGDRQMVRCV